MSNRKLIKILEQYTDRIRYNGNHYICYVKGGGVVTVSASPSDGNAHTQVFRDFRRQGIIIKEIKK